MSCFSIFTNNIITYALGARLSNVKSNFSHAVRCSLILKDIFDGKGVAPKIGDVVYIDKSYGSVSYYDGSKTPVGVVTAVSNEKKDIAIINLKNLTFSSEDEVDNFDADNLIKRFNNKEIGGVFLSNGPGDPKILKKEIKEISKLIKAKIPMLGICLGHQLLGLACGYETYKLPFGHHGANHPVKNMQTKQIEITSQNHIYSLPESIEEIATITHKNLFDGTIEGLKYKDSPIISMQHHPEASPGPREASKVFKDFFDMVANTN